MFKSNGVTSLFKLENIPRMEGMFVNQFNKRRVKGKNFAVYINSLIKRYRLDIVTLSDRTDINIDSVLPFCKKQHGNTMHSKRNFIEVEFER